MRPLEHQKDLYKKLVASDAFRRETGVLKDALPRSVWYGSENGKRISALACCRRRRPACAKRLAKRSSCERILRRMANKAKNLKRPVRFECGKRKFGICLPIRHGAMIYGYIFICNSETRMPDSALSLFADFIAALMREIQKEFELAKLYKTIRPRAIALSTIHTTHRIINSTLNLDELLPKLAMLCLQVFRVKKCYIILKNVRKRPAIIKAVKGNGNNKNINRANGGFIKSPDIKKVLSGGRTIMTRTRLCAPLTDDGVIGAIYITGKVDKAPFDIFDKEILATLSEQAAIAIKNAKLYKEQEDITIGSIKSIAAILNARTPGTYRVREAFIKIVLAMGENMKLKPEDLRNLHFAAILHDAGQIGFPEGLLTKKKRLTGKDYSIIKRHPFKSVSIVRHVNFLAGALPIILHHHENFDGTGYPGGLKGREIPLGSRIMAVASAFNAMVRKRPYRQKTDIKNAVAEIKKNSGGQFDPRVIKAFLEVMSNGGIKKTLKKGL